MRLSLLITGCMTFGLAAASALYLPRSIASETAPPRQADSDIFAAPGRIEGAQVPVSVGVDATGIIREIDAEEGQAVAAGQVLARVACDDLAAELVELSARADAANAHASLVRDGPRGEEILMATAQLHMAEARLREASSAHDRNASLIIDHFVATKSFLETQRDAAMASSQRDDALARVTMLKAGSRSSEIAEANALSKAAVAQRDTISARLVKCDVRSPIKGMILRKLISSGEMVSVTAPQPLFVVSDTSHIRVRAEIDEADISRLAIGETVEVVIGRGQGERFPGHVSEIKAQMGRRRIMTDDPGERSDRDVLEAMIDIDDLQVSSKTLPVGLRVSVLIKDIKFIDGSKIPSRR